jgi:hypothetical protein
VTHGARNGRGWEDDEIVTLKRMVAQNASASRIGEALNRSKNSVITKALSLGLHCNGKRGGERKKGVTLIRTPIAKKRRLVAPSLCDPWSAYSLKRWEERNA